MYTPGHLGQIATMAAAGASAFSSNADFAARKALVKKDCGCVSPDFACLTRCMLESHPWSGNCTSCDPRDVGQPSVVNESCMRLWDDVNVVVKSYCTRGDWDCLEKAYQEKLSQPERSPEVSGDACAPCLSRPDVALALMTSGIVLTAQLWMFFSAKAARP